MSLLILDIIILFGGVQALSLCFYLIFRKTPNPASHRFFLLLLLFLALFNLGYAAIFMEVQIGSFNLGNHPIPYKYLIAPALFAYVSYALKADDIRHTLRYLLIPAAIYFGVRGYWMYLIISGENPLIIRQVYDTGFFTVNEAGVLIFNLVVGWVLIRRIRRCEAKPQASFGTRKHWQWLNTLVSVFIILSAIHLLLIIASLLTLGAHDRLFYYPALIINTLFVYWIGFIGYAKSNLLFFAPLLKTKSKRKGASELAQTLKAAMETEKLFQNPKLTSQQLASHLKLPMHTLTRFIKEEYQLNFSQYLNQYRLQEAIALMSSELSEKYSLDALAKEAGFNSKSSFYKVFKEHTGQTPAAYLKSLK